MSADDAQLSAWEEGFRPVEEVIDLSSMPPDEPESLQVVTTEPTQLSLADVGLVRVLERIADEIGDLRTILARGFDDLATAFGRAKAPVVTANLPRQEPPIVNVTVPEQKAPVINVQVPKQEPPVVHVEAAAPVEVNVPAPVPMRKEIKRDSNGMIVSVTERPVKG